MPERVPREHAVPLAELAPACGLAASAAHADALRAYAGVVAGPVQCGPSGPSASAAHRQAASCTQAVTLSKPGIAAGTQGTVDFSFQIEGLVSSLSAAPFA
jgi:hypothetical protein